MKRAEYLLSAAVLRLCGLVFRVFPVRKDKVVFASARAETLEGNLKFIHDALVCVHPDAHLVFLLRRYSYDFFGKVRYLLGLIPASYHLATARLVIVDNAYLPIHVAPHRRDTVVVQVWHAAGALKKFGVDIAAEQRAVENTFVHRYYDWVIVGSDFARAPYSSALRTPVDRVIALGVARTDALFDDGQMAAAREKVLAHHPELRGRKVVLYAPTFRGYGREKSGARALDAARLKSRLSAEYALVHKVHPVLARDEAAGAGFDVVADADLDVNELFAVADVFVTDYSSSVFEWALLRRPIVLLADDLEEYERDPGFYLDFRRDMVGAFATSTDEVAQAIAQGEWDFSRYDDFVRVHCQYCDGHSSERIVEFLERFLA